MYSGLVLLSFMLMYATSLMSRWFYSYVLITEILITNLLFSFLPNIHVHSSTQYSHYDIDTVVI